MSLKKLNVKFLVVVFSLLFSITLLYTTAVPAKAADGATYTHKQLYIGTDPSGPLYEMFVYIKADDSAIPGDFVDCPIDQDFGYHIVEDTTGGLVSIGSFFGTWFGPEESDFNLKMSSGIPAGNYTVKAQADVGGGTIQTVVIPFTVINAPHIAINSPGESATIQMPAGVSVCNESDFTTPLGSIPVELQGDVGWRQEGEGISGDVSGSPESGETVTIHYNSAMNENFTYAYSDPCFMASQNKFNFYGILAGVSLNGNPVRPGGGPSNPAPSAPSTPSRPSVQIDPSETQVVYRLYNEGNKEHLYTTSAEEYNALVGGGWIGEGRAWKYPENGEGVEGVVRLYHPGANIHHYTKDQNEINVLTSQGWVKDFNGEPIFFSGGELPIYRLNLNGNHLFTTDENEYNTLGGQGWDKEGIGFLGVSL